MTKNTPKISIITVSFNTVKTIEQTILSVVNQTYPNIEYIIIDGGSTDGTVDIIKKYESKIAYWVSEPDKGIYDAMNKGIEKASGEWINFMNSGDEFYNNRVLSDIFSESISNEIDVFYGEVAIKYQKKESYKKPLPINQIEKGMVFCHQSSFVRTKLYKENPYNLTYKICADYNFFLSVYRKGGNFKYKSIVISKFLYGGFSSSSIIQLFVEKWHISGKGHDIYFLYMIIRELIFGKLRTMYLKQK